MVAAEKKQVTPVFTIEFASGNIRLDSGKVSVDMRDLLAKEVGRVRAKSSTFWEHPMDPGESLEDWQERCGDAADAEWAVRRQEVDEEGNAVGEPESIEDHIIRINSPRSSATDLALGVMNAFHILLTGDKDAHQIERKEFGLSNWKRVKTKLHDFCVEADVWVPEFAPPKSKSAS